MNTASRRIKGKGGAKPRREKFASTEEAGDFFWTAVIVSLVLHAAVFGIIWIVPARKAPKALQIFNVTVTTLPGPAGGGGKSHEQVKNPVKEEKPVPEKEPVKLAKKEVEKKPPRAKEEARAGKTGSGENPAICAGRPRTGTSGRRRQGKTGRDNRAGGILREFRQLLRKSYPEGGRADLGKSGTFGTCQKNLL